VVSSAAHTIARRKDDRTFTLLYELASRRPLTGVISALASFQRPTAIPIFINALGEDEVRLAAETALTSYGSTARSLLLDAADRFKTSNDLSESQLRKCRSILMLLSEIGVGGREMDRLRPFITSADTQVSVLACRIALCSGSKSTRAKARARLMQLRTCVPWLERMQIEQYLASAFD
jgi:hypothetical protein